MFLCLCLFSGFVFFVFSLGQPLIFLLAVSLGGEWEGEGGGGEKLVFLGYKLEQRKLDFLQAAFLKTLRREEFRWEPGEDSS